MWAMLVCAAPEQIREIVAASSVSDESYEEVFEKYSIGETPDCEIGYVSNVVVGDSEDLGIFVRAGKSFHLWIVHVGNAYNEKYCLYEEQPGDEL